MTTAEPVIATAVGQQKAYDVLGLVTAHQQYVPCTECHEMFRVRIVGVERWGAGHDGSDWEVEVALAAYGTRLCRPLHAAHSYRGKIDEWVFFPVTYAELPLDAMVCCTVRAAGGVVIGGTSFHVFTSRGRGKRGLRRYVLSPGVEADMSEASTTMRRTPAGDWVHLTRDFAQGRLPKVPWLDAIATKHIAKAGGVPPPTVLPDSDDDDEDPAVRTTTYVDPTAATPHRGLSRYPGTGASSSWVDFASPQLAARQASWQPPAPASPQTPPQGGPAAEAEGEEPPLLAVEFPRTSSGLPLFHVSTFNAGVGPAQLGQAQRDGRSTVKGPAAAARVGPQWATPWRPYRDHPYDNLAERKANALAKSANVLYDPSAVPGGAERAQLLEVAATPPIGEPLTADQAKLLFRFRHHARGDPRLCIPFMRCVDWAATALVQAAQSMLGQWQGLGLVEALAMAGPSFRGAAVLRRHAVQLLSSQSDDALQLVLLQLVQACRYDSEAGEIAEFLLARAPRCWALCSTMHWVVNVEVDAEAQAREKGREDDKNNKEGKEDPQPFTALAQRLRERLFSERPEFAVRLDAQTQLRQVLTTLYLTCKNDTKLERQDKARLAGELITQKACGIAELFSPNTPHGGVVYLPSHPAIGVGGITAEGVYLFKSAKMPIKVPFVVATEEQQRLALEADNAAAGVPVVPAVTTTPDEAHDDPAVSHGSGSAEHEPRRASRSSLSGPSGTPPGPTPRASVRQSQAGGPSAMLGASAVSGMPGPGETFAMMFKCGDDVRQDQLVIQAIELMDSLLKRNGLDLHLTPYRALAMSNDDGFVEIVPSVETLQKVRKDGVVQYIRRKNPAGGDKAVERFVKSCAGYCIITFLLGIGDRHLENLLVVDDGRLFHVDFGFILGKDPKPFPPPMKLNKEMVEAMGGSQGQLFLAFKNYCCSAFTTLRKHAHLLLHLLLLMVDANIPDISEGGKADPVVNIEKVQAKLRLDLSDAAATQYIARIIAESSSARITNLWDVVHEVVADAKN